jgi:carboxymethylenebutenolidase
MTIDQAHLDSLNPALHLDRRGFIATAIASGFSLAAGPVMAQTAIHTSADGLTAGMVHIPAAGGNMPAYRAQPQGGTHLATILVVSEIFGVHEHIQDICRRLAQDGYLAVAPELFARQGDPSKYTDSGRLMSEVVNKVPDRQVMGDLDATAKWAASHGGDPKRLGIIGFCWGGRQVWLYDAHNPNLKAAAVFYGPLRGKADPELRPQFPVDIAGQLHAPVRGAYGGKDQGITQDDIAAMQAALRNGSKAARDSVIEVYPNVGHAFVADYRPSYSRPEAQQAWARAIEWFRTHGLAP